MLMDWQNYKSQLDLISICKLFNCLIGIEKNTIQSLILMTTIDHNKPVFNETFSQILKVLQKNILDSLGVNI